MQIICTIALSPDHYAKEDFQRSIQRPTSCPHCGIRNALAALGYYSRNITSAERGVLRIFVRRFRCRCCGRTVSILPSFAQPYRLVLNTTINEFFGGTLGANSLSWLSLLQQYWNRFTKWIPEINRVIKSVVERSPPHPNCSCLADGLIRKLPAALDVFWPQFGTNVFSLALLVLCQSVDLRHASPKIKSIAEGGLLFGGGISLKP